MQIKGLENRMDLKYGQINMNNSKLNIHIRAATINDLREIITAFKAARSQMKYLPALHTPEEDTNYFKHQIMDGGMFIAETIDSIHNKIVGIMAVKDNWLNHLYIVPQFQKKGVGRVLLQEAQRQSATGFKLWVFQQNTGAIRFYEREGCVLLEERDALQADNEEHLPDKKYEWRPQFK